MSQALMQQNMGNMQQFPVTQYQSQEMEKARNSVVTDLFFSIQRLEAMTYLAERLVATNLQPVADQKTQRKMSVEEIVIIFQYGSELGLSPMVALASIDVIYNRPALKAQAMIALARRTGELTNFYYESSKDQATVYIQRKGQKLQEVTFTLEEARLQDLLGKPNWRKQQINMLIWRAVARAMRLFFPDAIGGLYTADELGSEDIIDVMPEVIISEPEPIQPQVTAEDLKILKLKRSYIAKIQELWEIELNLGGSKPIEEDEIAKDLQSKSLDELKTLGLAIKDRISVLNSQPSVIEVSEAELQGKE